MNDSPSSIPLFRADKPFFIDRAVADDYEAQVEDLTQRLNIAAADLVETRSQRAHLAKQMAVAAEQAIEHAKRHAQLFDEWLRERARLVDERDEARDEVVRLSRNPESQTSAFREERETLNAELVRLRTIIVELGAGEAAEPEEQVEALRSEKPPRCGIVGPTGQACRMRGPHDWHESSTGGGTVSWPNPDGGP